MNVLAEIERLRLMGNRLIVLALLARLARDPRFIP